MMTHRTAMCGCEMWFLILREEHRLRMFKEQCSGENPNPDNCIMLNFIQGRKIQTEII
jgi:hypothetical protein